MTYIFYDTETSGKLTAFDQILQFAAIKTDAELNVVDTFNARGIDRVGMEGFVVTVLRTAAIELEAYTHSAGPVDDVDGFLSWVRQQKMMSVPSKA
jgi:oligoribonuclease (3'-5' exoribonuclease)